ncbi:cyclohexanone monooxygenase [Streptomyces eurocidicus]|uniref:Cation diffusion facilitator CzcD-associated flavoprotein CzcO n=1 Tax=Streptomyces eurocidicus TaxID=66423 RepID=A0A2N8NU74_STREU|nr:NAD(P)/FAD-dependent oxidoreductase [Streptomyces eurocidicus]MBB5123225.1 cation diffusion facilitator CzcD-associated flavoprotein CzcO [Streptomyces eurocidicus]PNE32315.1 cyclohexanone monooxygenase [Streptomyces eurocidicus]
MPTAHQEAGEAQVVVVGAGFSGIGAAIQLRQAGFRDLVVLEKAGELGGTWRDNTYPGCACDVPSALYCYSFTGNPGGRRVFAGQREICDYLRATACRYGVDEVLRCGVEVRRAVWDASAGRWLLETTDGACTARALVLATGPWHCPRWPEIPGLGSFPGPVLHTSRWNESVELSGRRVAVVGSGASAIQLVPAIEARAAAVHLFQRTPQWVLPKPDVAIPPAVNWCLSRVPGLHRAVRAGQYGMQEAFVYAFRHPPLARLLQSAARAQLRLAVRDRELRRVLTPHYTMGCKRLLSSSTYFPALAKPHVHLHPTAVVAVEGNEVVGADGTREASDAIIMATGFHIGELPLAGRVHGGDGRTLADAWRGGREAYLGTMVSGFPNLFLLLGPNLLSGATSAVTVLEAQLTYVCGALHHLRREGAASLDVAPSVQASYNSAVQKALRTTVYNAGGCASYYFGPGGRNDFCWPWSTGRLVRLLSRFDPAACT